MSAKERGADDAGDRANFDLPGGVELPQDPPSTAPSRPIPDDALEAALRGARTPEDIAKLTVLAEALYGATHHTYAARMLSRIAARAVQIDLDAGHAAPPPPPAMPRPGHRRADPH